MQGKHPIIVWLAVVIFSITFVPHTLFHECHHDHEHQRGLVSSGPQIEEQHCTICDHLPVAIWHWQDEVEIRGVFAFPKIAFAFIQQQVEIRISNSTSGRAPPAWNVI